MINEQTTGQEPVLAVDGLVKVFRDFWHRPKVRAVDGVTIQVTRGQVFGLLGPNGSGKSTTIKIILGLLNATAGQVSVLGRAPHDVRVKARIGYLPEESYLYQYLTPRETLDFYGSLFGLDRKTRTERVEQLLEMVGLTHAADRPVGEFSKGMARRVGLAQALINDPELIILDEPTSGLDPIGCRQVKDLMLTLAKQGRTILLSSHLLADVEDVCDRIAILYNGTVRAEGRVNALLRKQDIMQVSVPVLEPEAMTALLAGLREVVGREPDIQHPSIDLEAFFLDVVAEAQGSAQTTQSPSLAPYLGEERQGWQ